MDLTIADSKSPKGDLIFFSPKKKYFQEEIAELSVLQFLFEDCRNRIKNWENLLGKSSGRRGDFIVRKFWVPLLWKVFKTMLDGAWNNLV